MKTLLTERGFFFRLSYDLVVVAWIAIMKTILPQWFFDITNSVPSSLVAGGQ